MIKDSEVFKIGKFIKPHGVKGEIAFEFENDVFDRVDCPYLICCVNGIFVPFFIEEYRFKGKDVALVTFEGIDREDKAQFFSGLEVYFPRKYYEEDTAQDAEYTWNFFIGFTVIDLQLGSLGVIKAIEDKTVNTLFLIEKADKEYIIPATEDFICGIDPKKKELHVELPEGLIE